MPVTSHRLICVSFRFRQIDDAIEATGLSDQKFVGTKLFRFRKGAEVPNGVFSAFRPLSGCSPTLLSVLSVPPGLVRTDGSGDVAKGTDAVFKCESKAFVMMTAADGTGTYVEGQVL